MLAKVIVTKTVHGTWRYYPVNQHGARLDNSVGSARYYANEVHALACAAADFPGVPVEFDTSIQDMG